MKPERNRKLNRYQLAMRIIVAAALLFFTALSFGLEFLWNGVW